jgi:hypothetical protein
MFDEILYGIQPLIIAFCSIFSRTEVDWTSYKMSNISNNLLMKSVAICPFRMRVTRWILYNYICTKVLLRFVPSNISLEQIYVDEFCNSKYDQTSQLNATFNVFTVWCIFYLNSLFLSPSRPVVFVIWSVCVYM